jgi:dTDP-4-amino-4,6-dideoxygalactose transaminase
MKVRIPLNRPTLVGRELEYIRRAIEEGRLGGDGPWARACSILLEQTLGVPKVFLTPSGTHALELAALLINVQPDDEVILPTFTFPSTANAFVLRGARPVFVDIRPDTLNLDEAQVPQKVTSRTKAIVPVHYGGVGCEMESIAGVARHYGLVIVEDNAHGLFGRYKGKPLGTFGALSAVSFHETKNLTCGEGGALLVNDPRYIEQAEIVREKGTDRARVLRGEIDRYTWREVGSSYLLSELQAAFLYAQLEAREQIQATRRRLWIRYAEHLRTWAEEHGVGLPRIPPECEPAYHVFYLLLPSANIRERLRRHLERQGIASAPHYVPLHLSEMGRRFGYRPGECPIAETVSERLLRLPLYHGLTESEQEQIIAAVRSFGEWIE